MAKPYPQVVLFGDSLFQGSVDLQSGFSFEAALQTRVSRRLDVINRGFSGWNTANAIKYLADIFPEPTDSSPKLEYLLILLGANDAVRPMPTTAQHVPLDEYKANLNKIVNFPAIKAHNPKILLVAPPPVDQIKIAGLDKSWGHEGPTRTSEITAAYAEKAREVARENEGVILIDLWQAIMDKAIAMSPGDYQAGGPWLGSLENGKQGGLNTLLPDGLHMNGEAYKVFYDIVSPHVGKQWEGLADDDKRDYIFPDWRELNIPEKQ